MPLADRTAARMVGSALARRLACSEKQSCLISRNPIAATLYRQIHKEPLALNVGLDLSSVQADRGSRMNWFYAKDGQQIGPVEFAGESRNASRSKAQLTGDELSSGSRARQIG